MKIDKSWWYHSCKKCLRTAWPHGNTYKCANLTCNTVGAPNPRYKLAFTAGDETGDTEFVMFGRIAQRLIKKTVDALITNNPPRFIPDEITRLLEKSFTFNVSFTENTITSGNVSFQANTIVAEIDDGNPLPMTPVGSQSSSVMLSQNASSKATHASGTTPSWSVVRNTKLAATPQSDRNPDESKNEGNILTSKVVPVAPSPVVPICSTLETQRSAAKKRARASPSKKTAKKLFVNDDAKIDGGDDCAGADEPRSGEDDA